VREVKSAGNLVADVEGDIEDVQGVLRITKIRLRYRFQIPPGSRDKVDRALQTYADRCPAYQSVKGCIECTWDAVIAEQA
jgi:uncharacterized OsmC-like protein